MEKLRKRKNKKEKEKLVIGLIGTIASGKGTVARYLTEEYGFKHIVMGNLIRALARKLGLKPTRENLHNLQAKYRAKYPNYFINKVIQRIKKSKHDKWVVDGLRHPEQSALLKKSFNARIILVDAPARLRWERARKRARGKEARESFEEFVRVEKEENKIFRFNVTKRYADYKIINDRSKEKLLKDLIKIMKKISKAA